MPESYVETFKSSVDFPKPFQRTGKFPLDRTDLFSSYEDAVKYAKGDRNDPDSRGLCGTSYIGQRITVYENGVVNDYQILEDRTLRKMSVLNTIASKLDAGELSVDIELPAGSEFLNINLYDSVTREQVFTDVSHIDNKVTVSLASEYDGSLDIVVFYYT